MQDTAHTHLRVPPYGSGPLATAGGPDPYASELVELGAGEEWTRPATGMDIQILVTGGTLDWQGRTFGPGGFVRATWTEGERIRSEAGCHLFVKTGPTESKADQTPTVAIDPADAPWSPGQGNLRVLPLDSRGAESTALVHWPAGERFLPHRHFGGEEIFVLSGTFQDEHGSYPAGSWIQSPHGSVHHPFVVEETRIWVKTGHLPPVQGQ